MRTNARAGNVSVNRGFKYILTRRFAPRLIAEVERLDTDRKDLEKDLTKKFNALKKRADQLDVFQDQLASSIGEMDGVGAKVADIKTLLQMKAEKQELDNIGSVIGGVRDDLHAIRGALPPKSLTDSVKSMKSEVDKKANRSEVNKLRKNLKVRTSEVRDTDVGCQLHNNF